MTAFNTGFEETGVQFGIYARGGGSAQHTYNIRSWGVFS